MNKKDLVIGVLGGMGTFATIHLFQQYTKVFPAVKEWERPRIVIDNNCTMPSRVRAFLYHEKVDELVDQMASSMTHLRATGCNRILLACNTSHLFLPEILRRNPKLGGCVVNIIDACVDQLRSDNVKEVYLLASEGTILSKVYQEKLDSLGIKCLTPREEDFILLRDCIEAVKQNSYSAKVKDIFLELLNRNDHCILGCTELPILFDMYGRDYKEKAYDPLYIALNNIHDEWLGLEE